MSSVGNYKKYVGISSKYKESLTGSNLVGYVNKISYTGGIDPLIIEETDMVEDWSSCNVPLTWYEAGQYLLCSAHPITKEEFRNYKSVNTCDNQVTSGWVQKPRFALINENYIFRGQVLHSYSINEKPLNPWFVTDGEGGVLAAHCDCVAGLGDTCIHVASLIRWVVLTLMYVEKLSCTSKERSWGLPPACVKRGAPGRLSRISFDTPATKLSRLTNKNSTEVQDSNPVDVLNKYKMSEEKKLEYYEKLNGLDLPMTRKPSILKVVAPYQDQFKNVIPMIAKLSTLYDKIFESYTLDELIDHGRSIDFSMPESALEMISNITMQQSKTKHWFELRAGRPSASVSKAVISCKDQFSNISLILKIAYPFECHKLKKVNNDPDHDPRLYGLHSEQFAKQAFLSHVTSEHENVSIVDAGLHIDPDNFILSASPDGFVFCSCHGKSCLEIKCPYVSRNEDVECYAQSKLSCLHKKTDGSWTLDKKHPFYYQVQTQMAITGCENTFFVVWTKKNNPHIEMIPRDPDFWVALRAQLLEYFYKSIIPELLAKYVTRVHKKSKKNVPKNIPTTISSQINTDTVTIEVFSHSSNSDVCNTTVPTNIAIRQYPTSNAVRGIQVKIIPNVVTNENLSASNTIYVPKAAPMALALKVAKHPNVIEQKVLLPLSTFSNDGNKECKKKPTILRR